MYSTQIAGMCMTTTALIFYPEAFIGFNKTQLLKRRLTAAGVIGARFKSSPVFPVGQNFRQYIPKAKSIHKYQSGVIHIQIQAVGIWATTVGRTLLERSNIVLIEGDAIEFPLERYTPLCELLDHITGDRYRVDMTNEPIRHGIAEDVAAYTVNLSPDSII